MSALTALRRDRFDAHAKLREATKATHERLHDLDQFVAIADSRLTRAGYRALLQSLHRYHCTISTAARRGDLTNLSSSAKRLLCLETDLVSLGAVPSTAPLVWSTPSRAALFGALYVAEGSAFGGKVIARELDYLFGDAPEGRSFFRGAGDFGAHWGNFLTALDRDVAESDVPDLVAGAEASFSLFEQCLAA